MTIARFTFRFAIATETVATIDRLMRRQQWSAMSAVGRRLSPVS